MHRTCQDTVKGPNQTKNSFCLLFSVSFLQHPVLPLNTSFWYSIQFHEILNKKQKELCFSADCVPGIEQLNSPTYSMNLVLYANFTGEEVEV